MICEKTESSSCHDGAIRRKEKLAQSLVHDLCFWDHIGMPEMPNKKPLSRRAISSGDAPHDSTGRLKNEHFSDHSSTASTKGESERAQSFGDLSLQSELRWQAAVDPATGETYYYNSVTMQSQWKKPREIRLWEREKRKRERAFFREMEENILASLERKEPIPGISAEAVAALTSNAPLMYSKGSNTSAVYEGKTNDSTTSFPSRSFMDSARSNEMNTKKIRTISGMDERVLADLYYSAAQSSSSTTSTDVNGKTAATTMTKIGDQGGASRPRPPLHPHQQRQSQGEVVTVALLGAEDQSLDCSAASDKETIGRCFLRRHHTSENVPIEEVDSTLINPDVVATIKCVCGVYRVYVVENAKKKSNYNNMGTQPHHYPLQLNQEPSAAFGCLQPQSQLQFVGSLAAPITPGTVGLFRDDYEVLVRHGYDPASAGRSMPIPSIDEMVQFFTAFHRTSKMQQDTVIMTLIYLERLMKYTNGALVPTPENWRSLLFSCMILASKVWDDFSMWNVDFSFVSAATGLATFSLKRINRLEVVILSSLMFDVQVTDSEYAKYYFLIRTMMIRSSTTIRSTSNKTGTTPSKTATNKTQKTSVEGTEQSKNANPNRYRIDVGRGSTSSSSSGTGESRRSWSGDWVHAPTCGSDIVVNGEIRTNTVVSPTNPKTTTSSNMNFLKSTAPPHHVH
ncbi:hypothetical protein ACA910_008310 [Epithemia clementina (nom. ined.)]